MQSERSTKQKLLFKHFLEQNRNCDMTVQEMAEKLELSGTKMGIATVYRAVRRLEDDGVLIRSVGGSGAKATYRYVGSKNSVRSVHRVFCTSCGQTTDLTYKLIDKFEKNVSDTTDFSITDHQIMLYGICPNCK